MIKRLLLASTMFCGLGVAAHAADLPAGLPVKAPVDVFLPNAGGWYWGVTTEMGVAQGSINGNNLFVTSLATGNLTATGGAVGLDVGYIGRGFAGWYRVEASAYWQNVQGGNTAIGSVSSRWSAKAEVDVGAEAFQSLMAVFGSNPLGLNFPTFTAPALPSNIAVLNSPRQYFGAGIRASDLGGQVLTQSGDNVSIAPMLTTGFLWQTINKTTGKPDGHAIDVYAYVAWPTKGLTLSGVLANGGTPFRVETGATIATEYGLGLKYDFSL